MKQFAATALIAASLATAQVTYNSTSGIYTCAPSHPDGAYCAGDSLQTNIIIRCTNGVGQPGNCNDNLAGEPPIGVNYAPCYETSDTSGDAACSKNCIVYPDSSNSSSFTLPSCTPTPSSTSQSEVSATSTTESVVYPTSTTKSVVYPMSISNGTTSTAAASSPSATPVGPSATTSGPPSSFSGAAIVNSAGPLAAAGLIMAYFL